MPVSLPFCISSPPTQRLVVQQPFQRSSCTTLAPPLTSDPGGFFPGRYSSPGRLGSPARPVTFDAPQAPFRWRGFSPPPRELPAEAGA